ncbi:MAG: ATP-binding protein [Dehalococcoidia bacterium]|jgi:predicted kinase
MAEGQSSAVDRFLQALGPLPPPQLKSALVVISGLPGTGKSQFARELQRSTSAVVLESDALRRLLVEKPSYSWQESRRLFAVIHAVAERLLCKGIPVILDATNLAEAYRRTLYEIAARCGARLLVVEVTAPAEVARTRLAERAAAGGSASDADVGVYERMLPAREEIRREHFVVDTSKPYDGLLRVIARAMKGGARQK